MSDSNQIYLKIYKTLKKQMKGVKERYMIVLAMMMAGLIKSKRTHYRKMAEHAPSQAWSTTITLVH